MPMPGQGRETTVTENLPVRLVLAIARLGESDLFGWWARVA